MEEISGIGRDSGECNETDDSISKSGTLQTVLRSGRAVSYTYLDVYKRQVRKISKNYFMYKVSGV